MKPADVADLIAFLRTLPAVQGRTPPHKLAFPFSVRRAVGLWKLLYFDNAGLKPVAGRSEDWTLGRYLAKARPLRRMPYSARCAWADADGQGPYRRARA